MRKVIVFNMITADGYFEGPNHELDWHNVNDEFNEFAIAQLKDADTLVFGRRTYELMASYWPLEAAQDDDPDVAAKMNDAAKIVFSHTLKTADWRHTTILGDNAMKQFRTLKAQPGKNLLVMGSSNLCTSLLQEGLVDEIRLMVNPVVLGVGNTLFAGVDESARLRLIDTRDFASGNMLLRYTTV